MRSTVAVTLLLHLAVFAIAANGEPITAANVDEVQRAKITPVGELAFDDEERSLLWMENKNGDSVLRALRLSSP